METTVSDVEIANLAFSGLGVERIAAFDEENEQARTVNAVYPLMRDEVLSAYPWRFAMDRKSLSLLSDAPSFGYDNAFQIPSDVLRVISTDLDEFGYAWEREGDKILTDQTSVKIKFIKKVTDATKFSPAFISAFAARLEAELAYPLTSNADLGKAKYSVYLEKLRVAKTIDAQESRSMKTMNDNAWLNSRESGQVS